MTAAPARLSARLLRGLETAPGATVVLLLAAVGGRGRERVRHFHRWWNA